MYDTGTMNARPSEREYERCHSYPELKEKHIHVVTRTIGNEDSKRFKEKLYIDLYFKSIAYYEL